MTTNKYFENVKTLTMIQEEVQYNSYKFKVLKDLPLTIHATLQLVFIQKFISAYNIQLYPKIYLQLQKKSTVQKNILLHLLKTYIHITIRQI